MSVISPSPKVLLLAALLATPASGSLAAQAQDTSEAVTGSVTDTSAPEPATKGPKIEGIISARSGNRMQVTSADGTKSVIAITDATQIKASGGFLSLNRTTLAANLNRPGIAGGHSV